MVHSLCNCTFTSPVDFTATVILVLIAICALRLQMGREQRSECISNTMYITHIDTIEFLGLTGNQFIRFGHFYMVVPNARHLALFKPPAMTI